MNRRYHTVNYDLMMQPLRCRIVRSGRGPFLHRGGVSVGWLEGVDRQNTACFCLSKGFSRLRNGVFMQLKFATSAVVRKGDERTAVSLKNNTFSIFWQKLAGGVQQEIVKTTFPVHLHPESPVSRRRCQTKTDLPAEKRDRKYEFPEK